MTKNATYVSEIQRARALDRVVSADVRERLRSTALGRRLSPETKAKIAQAKLLNDSVPRGERHYKWKGGRSWERFKEPRYLKWRAAVLERDAFTCRGCDRTCKKYERGLAAHHIKPFAVYVDLRYDLANGLTLCEHCHMQVHGKRSRVIDLVPCACGCGSMIPSEDAYGRERRFVNGHGRRKRAS